MTPKERRAKNCAQHRERYYWYKEHGICVRCGQEDAAPGKVKCEECAAKEADRSMAAYYRQREEQREEQREAMRRRQRDRYAKRRTEGLCTDCGKTVSTGKRLCLDCSLRRRRYGKRFFDAHRRVKTDFSDGLCCKCNEPVVPGKKLCARHYAIAAANARKAHAQRPNGNHGWRRNNRLIFKKKKPKAREAL